LNLSSNVKTLTCAIIARGKHTQIYHLINAKKEKSDRIELKVIFDITETSIV